MRRSHASLAFLSACWKEVCTELNGCVCIVAISLLVNRRRGFPIDANITFFVRSHACLAGSIWEGSSISMAPSIVVVFWAQTKKSIDFHPISYFQLSAIPSVIDCMYSGLTWLRCKAALIFWVSTSNTCSRCTCGAIKCWHVGLNVVSISNACCSGEDNKPVDLLKVKIFDILLLGASCSKVPRPNGSNISSPFSI